MQARTLQLFLKDSFDGAVVGKIAGAWIGQAEYPCVAWVERAGRMGVGKEDVIDAVTAGGAGGVTRAPRGAVHQHA